MAETTIGQLMINDLLPEELRDPTREITSRGSKELLRRVAAEHPEKYRDVVHGLMKLGASVATTYGGEASISLNSLRVGEKTQVMRTQLRRSVEKIRDDDSLSDEQKEKRILLTVGRIAPKLQELNFSEALENRNALALQVNSGARGNPAQFKSTVVGDSLVVDHRDEPIPIPLLNSYAEGLDPVEYWAGSYGARKGTIATKMATPKGGFLGKQLAAAAHRLVVTEEDCGTTNGVTVDPGDSDNVGTVLAKGYGGSDAGTVLTPKINKSLKRHKRIMVRSPITCQAMGGICQQCAGIREKGDFPPIGDNIGLAAAQAISEPVTQAAMEVKHTGGVAGASSTTGGFDRINQLVQVPKTFKGGAAIASLDGRVERIDNAPQGGKYVFVGGERHYVPSDRAITVKPGEVVEAGDIMSEGLPNPAHIVKHKGVGAGRWEFLKHFMDTLKSNRVSANRRNVELLSRGLINHVRVTGLNGPGDTLPDDVVEFDNLTRGYEPRVGFRTMRPHQAKGMFLEQPTMHYSIGTRVTPRVSADLRRGGVETIKAHADAPEFQPEVVRAMETLSYAPDWMVQMSGFHLKKNLIDSVHRGRGSTPKGVSYVPSLAQTQHFGKAPLGVAGQETQV